MSTTSRTNFRQLQELIRVCGNSGVRRLKFQDIEVEFLEVAKHPGPDVTPFALAGAEDLPDIPTTEKTLDAGFDGTSQAVLDEIEDAQRLMDDPLGFEADQIALSLEKDRIEGEKRESGTTKI